MFRSHDSRVKSIKPKWLTNISLSPTNTHLYFKIINARFKRTPLDIQNKYRIYEKLMGGKDVYLSMIG